MLKNSEAVKNIEHYYESYIFGLWKISIINLVKKKVSLAKNFHIQPSEIDNMVMWEYEYFLKEMNDQIEEENKETQEKIKNYNINDYTKNNDIKKLENSISFNPSSIKFPKV